MGQYYNFLRLGRTGYTRVMETLRDIVTWLSGEIAKLGPFDLPTSGAGRLASADGERKPCAHSVTCR